MQALSKLSSYVCNKSFVMFPTVINSLSVGVFSCKRIAPQFPPLWRDSPSSTGQRKVRLSEGRPILVTFHLSLVLVGATNIFSELIHPLLKLPNCVLKQQLQILQLSSYYLKRSARLSPSSRSRNRLCRRTATSIHSCLIFQKTLHCTRKQRSRLTCPTYSGMWGSRACSYAAATLL